MRGFAGRRGHILAVAILLLLPLVFFWEMAVQGEEPVAPDVQAWLPLGEWKAQAQEELGEVPLWCPAIFSGMPAYGSFIATPSPPMDLMRLVREGLGNRSGRTFYLYLVVGSLALYLWLVLRGASPLGALCGALAFTMTPYMLGLISAGHNTKIRALYMAPLIFLALETLLRKRSLAATGFLAIALGFQLWCNHPQITYYTLLLVALYLVGVLILQRPDRWRGRGIAWGLLLGLLAVVLAGALVMDPFATVLEYSPHSIRGSTSALAQETADAAQSAWDYATAWSFVPRELICFLFPAWFGLEGGTYWGTLPFTQSTHYLGITVLVLALLGLLMTRGRSRWIPVGLFLFVLLVGFGRHVPILYRPMYEWLPMFHSFRVPSMIYAMLPLPAALLVARGIDAVLRDELWPSPRRAAVPRKGEKRAARGGAPAGGVSRWSIAAAALAILFLLWLVAGGVVADGLRRAGSFLSPREAASMDPEQLRMLQSLSAEQLRAGGAGLIVERMELLRSSVTVGLGLLAAMVGLIEARRRRWLPAEAVAVLLFVLVAADLWIIDRRFYNPQPAARSEAVLQGDELTAFLQRQESPFRVAPLRGSGPVAARAFGSNRMAAFGVETVGGYQAAKLRIYDDLIRSGAIDRLPVLSMLNASFLLSDRELEGEAFTLATRARVLGGQELLVYRNPMGSRRAWFVERHEPLPDARDVVDRLLAPDFDPATTATSLADESSDLPERFSPGRVISVTTNAQEVSARVAVEGPEPGLLVFSEIYYEPGWRMRIDEETQPVRRVNHVLRAALVPPGEHTVRMESVSPARELGLLLSRLAAGAILLLLAAAGGFAAWHRRAA